MRRSCALLFALVALAPARGADPKVSDSLQPFVEKKQLAGAVVLVASPDKVLTVETAGFADREGAVAMQPISGRAGSRRRSLNTSSPPATG